MNIHFVGVAGTAMGSVAVACRSLGYAVTGSDTGVYPPMSDVLSTAGIRWYDGYSAERMMEGAPDLVVIGNAISRGNPELEHVLNARIPYTSMAAFVGEHLIGRSDSIVICGTHGKTTTSSVTAWMLESAGRQPGFLIGGVPLNFGVGCRAVPSTAPSPTFVSEGDEYDTAFFDKRSKFVHYRPTIAAINNIEFDHADIFDSLEQIIRSFEHMVRIVPGNGVVLVNADDANARTAASRSTAPVELVGMSSDAYWRISDLELQPERTEWTLHRGDATWGRFATSMPGEHAARNCSIAIAATAHVGVSAQEQQQALASFEPPKRRMERIGTWNGCTVIDDFAHHPTAIRATMQALQQTFPGQRLHVLFEPRSNTTTRAFFQHELGECFIGATSVCLGPVNRPERYAVQDRLDTVALKRQLESHGIATHVVPADRASDPQWGKEAHEFIAGVAQASDVIAILSNGSVGGLRAMLTGGS
jgi:UDP-N-acetylmuramate: L-alanyl-gamma-D-glutamyl-meso-diaminopimelate ligase